MDQIDTEEISSLHENVLPDFWMENVTEAAVENNHGDFVNALN